MSSVIYCPRCHSEAYRRVETGDKISIVQNGKSVLNLNKQSSIEMHLKCPAGHPVELKIGEANATGNQ